MASQLSLKAPCTELKELKNLWFQLSSNTCNLKCKHCYLSCMPVTKPKFLGTDKIKAALEIAREENLSGIYLNGGEPLMHPEINNIIRMSLKITNVTILTNGLMLNDKKTRFLRQIEKDHDNEIVFRISLDHYIEEKNDDVRGRGSYRKTVSGIENLIRNGFNPIISAVNVWNEEEESFKSGFYNLFKKIGFEPEELNVKIIAPIKTGEFAKNFTAYEEDEIITMSDNSDKAFKEFDCTNSRVISENGVFTCPALVNDTRGKVGNSLEDYSKKFFLEPHTCSSCLTNKAGLFTNSW